MTTNAKDSLMLVRLSISRWNPRRFDRTASDEVAHARGNQSARDVGRFNKVLIALNAIKPVQHAIQALQAHHHRSTAPWTDDGVRVLPARCYMAYAKRLGELRDRVEAAVAEFADGDYMAECAAAKARLKDLYDPADYPAPEEIKRRFAVRVRFSPLPNEGDVNAWGLSVDDTKAMRDEVAATRDDAIRDAHRAVCDDLLARCTEFVDKLRRYESKPANGLRETAIENLREVVDSVMSGLNITGDKQLAQTADAIHKVLADVTVDDLRGDPVACASKRAAVDAIAAKFSGMFAAPTATEEAA